MVLRPFEQVYSGQNNPDRQPKTGTGVETAEWERKQRFKEYRIAANREKRNRKADDKKQRKLNATILRRMTRNPAKYSKNTGRNRVREIEQERQKIRNAAINMAQRLAAVHDPTGALFNVKPVTTLEDGRVVTLEDIELKKEKEAEVAGENEMKGQADELQPQTTLPGAAHINPERMKMLLKSQMLQTGDGLQGMRKTQMKKQGMLAPRPPPPKPTIPDGIDLPSDEEENWLELWSLPDEELEHRVLKGKKRKAGERKELRTKQKTGKGERRAARDEKRRVYREIKQCWKILQDEEGWRRKELEAMEEEENNILAMQITNQNRARAMEVCAELGFTLENVEEVKEIKPKALGMKGFQVDFNALEVVGDAPSALKLKDERREKLRSNRVDLGSILGEEHTKPVTAGSEGDQSGMTSDFVEVGSDVPRQDHEAQEFNHQLRRKLRRAIENAQIRKELLVREAAIKHCKEKGMVVPEILRTATKPENKKGVRTMPDGTLETAKQERVRSKVESTEYNKMAKILRRQAKEMSIEAGIRIYLELMGRIPKREGLAEQGEWRARAMMETSRPGYSSEPRASEGDNGTPIGGIWPAQSTAAMTMEDFMAGWPIPQDPLAKPASYSHMVMDVDVDMDEQESSEDSAAKQLKTEMAASGG